MKIKILGTGCPNCKTLEKRVRRVIKKNNLSFPVEMVNDIEKIMTYNILFTPALVINDEVIVKGRVLSEKEILSLITNN